MKDKANGDFGYNAILFSFFLLLVYTWQIWFGFEPGFSAGSSPWWKFFTSFFGHSDLEHLFNNLFFIGLFGSIYELVASGRTFLTTFILSALLGNVTAFIFFPGSVIIGASGGAAGVLAALAVYRPNKIGLVFGIPAPMWAVLLGYIGLNLAGLGAANNVAYEAHLFGMFAGAVVGMYLRSEEENDEEKFEDDLEDEEIVDNWKRKIKKWERRYMLDS